MSKLYFNANRSVSWVILTIEMSARLCHDCRKILRWPEENRPVSNVSPHGTPLTGVFAGVPGQTTPPPGLGSKKRNLEA